MPRNAQFARRQTAAIRTCQLAFACYGSEPVHIDSEPLCVLLSGAPTLTFKATNAHCRRRRQTRARCVQSPGLAAASNAVAFALYTCLYNGHRCRGASSIAWGKLMSRPAAAAIAAGVFQTNLTFAEAQRFRCSGSRSKVSSLRPGFPAPIRAQSDGPGGPPA